MRRFGLNLLKSFRFLTASQFLGGPCIKEFSSTTNLCDQNPYDVLGLDRDCTHDDIKKRFKQLAKKYHPDVSKEENAKEKFQEINSAYQILSDQEKRDAFDRFGTSDNIWEGQGQGYGGYEDINFGDFSSHSIFEDLFQGFGFDPFSGFSKGSNRGADLYYAMEVEFEEIAYGGSRTMELEKPKFCKSCGGSGEESGTVEICGACEGMGFQAVKQMGFMMQMTCQHCGGTGQVSQNCEKCEGTGYKQKKARKKVKIKIPIGAEDGHIIRLEGYGEQGFRGGEPGDLFIEIMVKPNRKFKRKNEKDVTSIIEISMVKALLGGSEKVRNIKGDEMDIIIPPNSQYGDEVILVGEGIQNSKFLTKAGDLIFRLRVTLPEYELSQRQIELLNEFLEEENKKPSDDL